MLVQSITLAAQEYGVELSKVIGTGPGGRISREDVLAASKQATVAKPRQLKVLKRTKLEGIRKAVAERLSFSARNVVAVTLTMEADATGLVRLKERENHLSFTAFAVKAVAKNLMDADVQVPGFRRTGLSIEQVLNRYIPTLTIIGGVLIGLVASVSDLFGVFGSGIGILLMVDIVLQYYQMLLKEQIEEFSPGLAGLLGAT
jgi:hypothetical protein